MAKVYYTKYIVPTESDNIGVTSYLDEGFRTTDYMYIESPIEIVKTKLGQIVYKSAPSDYCLANNVTQSQLLETPTGEFVAQWWTRAPHSRNMVEKYNTYGDFMASTVDSSNIMVCPATQLDVEVVEAQRQISNEIFDIQEVKDNKGKILYHTISFGVFPNSYVGDDFNRELDIRYCTGQAKSTGKKYTSRMGVNGNIEYSEEYEYYGQKYVRVKNKQYFNAKFKDGTEVKDGKYSWMKVEPIIWKILNWEEMPTSLNPNGKGTAKTMKVRSEQGVVVLPFYPNNMDVNRTFWQNSTLRGYLNGLNVNNLTQNGNKDYASPDGGDFTGEQNFLQEAGIGLIITMIQNRTSEAKLQSSQRKEEVIDVRIREDVAAYIIKKYIDNLNGKDMN